ncbi:MAG: succinate dehydrogenase, cytochrome b556 subunit [Rhizobiaceae bacterium]|nr:succinate dehydrogenase, cytochrome b556 subunit [Rhizobiaceae bacterium]MCV0407653.1 succinate dehydrogenase, cytochrome b556 subunit [Rhizobiaceae bacterium]
MSETTATKMRPRPLSPHLFIYRPIPTMVMSIMHRITGGALYVGTLLVAWWLIAAATSPVAFNTANAVFGSVIGRLVLFGYTWVLMHHMLGGIRHLVWDTGSGLEKETATKIAIGLPIASFILTILIWIVGYMARG